MKTAQTDLYVKDNKGHDCALACYEAPKCEIVIIECEGNILAGSIEDMPMEEW